MILRTEILATALLLAMASGSSARMMFGTAEKREAMAYWDRPGAYTVSDPSNIKSEGAWQVRLTTEASTWLWELNRARGIGKGIPGAVPQPRNEEERTWESWINARIDFDRAQAALEARKKNVEQLGLNVPALTSAVDPGNCPSGLLDLVGEPPRFAEAVQPKLHSIKFDDGQVYGFTDNPMKRPRYNFYRFRQGVQHGGIRMDQFPKAELRTLLNRAGISDSEQRVFEAVSLLEGGFDSVNTYDTGFVSVGFIQFACLRAGSGSLGRVLVQMKSQHPAAYERDFSSKGIDVTPAGTLSVLNLETGEELQGNAAAMQIIEDKRLIAIFQRSARVSAENKIAQLQVAKQMYYPADDAILANVNGATFGGRVKDVIRSEAGMATLMDRKVNTGSLGALEKVISGVISKYGLKSLAEAAAYEFEIVTAMRYRKNYLSESTLSQPVQKPDKNSSDRPPFLPGNTR